MNIDSLIEETHHIIKGEILIPLENTLTFNTNDKHRHSKFSFNPSTPLTIFTNNSIESFRSIIFQNELLRFFIVISYPLNNSYINFPTIDEHKLFLSSLQIETHFNSNVEDNFFQNESNEEIIKVNTMNINGNITTELAHQDKSNIILNKYFHYNESEKNITFIIEIQKHILVPSFYVNNSIVMKVQITKPTNIISNPKDIMKQLEKIGNESNNHIKNINLNKIIILNKEVKIVRPLYVSQTKQLDCTSECSILQIKIDNITSTLNYIDNSLKKSFFINLFENSEHYFNNLELVNYGITFCIKDINVLKQQTIIENTMALNLIKREQHKIENKQKVPGVAINNIIFEVLNHEFPIEIKPGEEYNISLKLLKDKDIYQYDEVSNELIEMNTNDNIDEINYNNQFMTIDSNENEQILTKRKGILNLFSKNNKKAQTNGIDYVFKEDDASIMSTNMNTTNRTSSINNNSSPSSFQKKKKKLNIERDDQIIKLTMTTPIIVSLCSNCDEYENMYMKIHLKWKTDLNNQMTIYFQMIETYIKLNHFFSVKLLITNNKYKSGNYSLSFGESLYTLKLKKENFTELKSKCKDNIPSVLSEVKLYQIGTLNHKETTELTLRFLPTKVGFTTLPPFQISDLLSGRIYFIANTNKIYVHEN